MSYLYTDYYQPDSQAIEKAYYHNESHELYIVLHGGNGYLYNEVPAEVWNQFREHWSAGSFYARNIKRTYGPSEHLGYLHDWEFEKDQTTSAPDMGPVVDGNAALSGPNFTLTNSGTFTAGTINLSSRPVRKHTVYFNSGISDRSYVVETTSVDEAVADLMRIAEILGIADEITVKEVVTHFE